VGKTCQLVKRRYFLDPADFRGAIISMMIFLMVGSSAIFIVSVSFLFLFRDTIDDSIWFIPLLSGVIVGFLFLLAAVSKFIPQHPQA